MSNSWSEFREWQQRTKFSGGMTIFIDLDGTVFDHTTQQPIGSAIEDIKEMHKAGFTIVLTTLRGPHYTDGHKYSVSATEEQLRKHDLPYHHIIYGLPSPRVVINDSGAFAGSIEENGWDESLTVKRILEVAKRVNGEKDTNSSPQQPQ